MRREGQHFHVSDIGGRRELGGRCAWQGAKHEIDYLACGCLWARHFANACEGCNAIPPRHEFLRTRVALARALASQTHVLCALKALKEPAFLLRAANHLAAASTHETLSW